MGKRIKEILTIGRFQYYVDILVKHNSFDGLKLLIKNSEFDGVTYFVKKSVFKDVSYLVQYITLCDMFKETPKKDDKSLVCETHYKELFDRFLLIKDYNNHGYTVVDRE